MRLGDTRASVYLWMFLGVDRKIHPTKSTKMHRLTFCRMITMNPRHIICWLDAIDVGFYRIWDKFLPHLMLPRGNSEQNRRQSQFSKSMSMQKKTELMSPSTHRWGLARCQQWGLKIERDISPLQSPVNRSLLISSITEKTLLHHIKYWKSKNH